MLQKHFPAEHSKKLENNNDNNETEVPKERYISPEKRQQITDGLRVVPKKDVYFLKLLIN